MYPPLSICNSIFILCFNTPFIFHGIPIPTVLCHATKNLLINFIFIFCHRIARVYFVFLFLFLFFSLFSLFEFTAQSSKAFEKKKNLYVINTNHTILSIYDISFALFRVK